MDQKQIYLEWKYRVIKIKSSISTITEVPYEIVDKKGSSLRLEPQQQRIFSGK